MQTLYLIDGYAQFFRHYHAIRTPMTSPVTKEPTNMTYGFVGMLLKLLRAEEPNLRRLGKPDYIAVALDVSGDRGTFRSQLDPQYKATRSEPPDDLEPQVQRCLKMLGTLGVPVVGAAGFEADDVIATIVRRLRKEKPDLKIRIISKDKDLKQLFEVVAEGEESPVELFDIHTDLAFDARSLNEDLGLTPDQVVDMLTLTGDTVDNVKGVDGVGEKTAALLLREWKTLDNLLAHADEIKGKRGEKLREAIPRLALAKQLVTLKDDVEIDFSLDRSRAEQIKLRELIPILRELGFNRYQDDVRKLVGEPADSQAPADDPDAEDRTSTPRRVKRSVTDFGGMGLFDALEKKDMAEREVDGSYRCVRTAKELGELVSELGAAAAVAFDTETTSLSPRDAKLCGLSFSTKAGTGWYVPVRSPSPGDHLDEATVLNALRPILEDAKKPKIGHNIKYDMMVLREAGVELGGLETTGSCDTMVASYLIDASRSSHSLDALALALLGRTNISITELIGSGKQQRCFDTVPIEQATTYAAEDADVTLRLSQLMMPQLERDGMRDLMQKVEMPLVGVLAELEHNGILVDPKELDSQRDRLQALIDGLLAELKEESIRAIDRTFDPDSPKQLAVALFNKPTDEPPGLGIKPIKKTKTGFSTDAEVLEKLAEDDSIETPIPKLILQYRQLSKLVSTYLVALKEAIHPRTKRVHASFNQTVAATGRLSSSDPNLQNIPIRTDLGREIRRAFIAPPGCVLITADYSQIELRLLAHLSQDPALIEAFRQDQDIHTAVAAQIHGVPPDKVTRDQRSGAKMVNFGIVYGITAFGLARRLGIDKSEAGAIIDGYKRRFAGITTFLVECVEQARRQGFVETMLKRRRPIPDVDSNNPSRRALAERLAINSVVQGSAADLIKVAMVDLHRRIRDGSDTALKDVRMLLQIHDELVFEAPETTAPAAMALIRERMEAAMDLSVPLKADAAMGKNWFEGK